MKYPTFLLLIFTATQLNLHAQDEMVIDEIDIKSVCDNLFPAVDVVEILPNKNCAIEYRIIKPTLRLFTQNLYNLQKVDYETFNKIIHDVYFWKEVLYRSHMNVSKHISLTNDYLLDNLYIFRYLPKNCYIVNRFFFKCISTFLPPEKLEELNTYEDDNGVRKVHVNCGEYLNKQDAIPKQTALHISARYDYKSMLKTLLALGGDQTIPDFTGCIPLHESNTEIIETLLSYINPNNPYIVNHQDEDGSTPLHFAAQAPTPNKLELLLKAGADPNIQNNNGRTPLHNAAVSRREKNMNLLIKHGADETIRDKNGETAEQIF